MDGAVVPLARPAWIGIYGPGREGASLHVFYFNEKWYSLAHKVITSKTNATNWKSTKDKILVASKYFEIEGVA